MANSRAQSARGTLIAATSKANAKGEKPSVTGIGTSTMSRWISRYPGRCSVRIAPTVSCTSSAARSRVHYGLKNRCDPGRMVQEGEAITLKRKLPNRWDAAIDKFGDDPKWKDLAKLASKAKDVLKAFGIFIFG